MVPLVEIDFSQVTSYDTFTPEVTYTLVADADVTTKLFATGGGGGGSDVRSVAGSKGGLAEGTFTFVKDQEYKLIVGSGGDIVTAGRPGGGTGGGTRGSSGRGGGGGYTGLFEGSITHANAIIIGGGGGGSTGDVGHGGAGGGNEGNAGSNGGRAGLGGGQSGGGSVEKDLLVLDLSCKVQMVMLLVQAVVGIMVEVVDQQEVLFLMVQVVVDQDILVV